MRDETRAPLRAELAADVRRVSDRLRGLSLARLQGAVDAGPDSPTRAGAARAAAQLLADAAAALESTERRTLPELADFAAGDQVAVTGHDLLAALDAGDGPPPDVVVLAAEALAELRRRL